MEKQSKISTFVIRILDFIRPFFYNRVNKFFRFIDGVRGLWMTMMTLSRVLDMWCWPAWLVRHLVQRLARVSPIRGCMPTTFCTDLQEDCTSYVSLTFTLHLYLCYTLSILLYLILSDGLLCGSYTCSYTTLYEHGLQTVRPFLNHILVIGLKINKNYTT